VSAVVGAPASLVATVAPAPDDEAAEPAPASLALGVGKSAAAAACPDAPASAFFAAFVEAAAGFAGFAFASIDAERAIENANAPTTTTAPRRRIETFAFTFSAYPGERRACRARWRALYPAK
jgi:hypothetical protein